MFNEKQLATKSNIEESTKNDILDSMVIDEKSSEARTIARLGDFDLIEQRLHEQDLMQKERNRVRNQFSQFIESTDFPTKSEQMWDLLTILELYDPETAIHSIKTYQIAKEKIEKILSRNILFSEIIQNEGVDLERFYFACLNHDIGKVEIPHFIIQNATTKDQWREKLEKCLEREEFSTTMLSRIGFDPKDKPNSSEIAKRITDSCLRAEELLSVREGLTEDEIRKLEQDWDISPDLSLMDIIDEHADISGNIFERKDFPIAAEIVRGHHHKTPDTSSIVSIDSLEISSDMADILHLADVKQALESVRSYKEGFTPLQTVSTLVEHAEQGRIGKEITYFWVKDEFYKLEKHGMLNNLGFAEAKTLEYIKRFIDKFEFGENKDDLDKWIVGTRNCRFAAGRLRGNGSACNR